MKEFSLKIIYLDDDVRPTVDHFHGLKNRKKKALTMLKGKYDPISNNIGLPIKRLLLSNLK